MRSSARRWTGSASRTGWSRLRTAALRRLAREQDDARRPSAAELTRALGFPTELDELAADVVVVGADARARRGGLRLIGGLRTTVIDAGAVGGQAGSSSLIRNYLGFPRGLAGGVLAYQQAWLFGTRFRLTERVVELELLDGGFAVHASDGVAVSSRAVVLALGVEYRGSSTGSRRVGGAGVYYGASMSEAQALSGRGRLRRRRRQLRRPVRAPPRRRARVTVVVRGASLAESMSRYLIDALEEAPNIDVRHGTEIAVGAGDGRLERLTLRCGAEEEAVAAAALFILIGARPRTDWLPTEIERDEGGYLLTGARAGSSRLTETSVPGVFAAGDVRAGGVKRVAKAVGDGALAVSEVRLPGRAGGEQMARPQLILLAGVLALPLAGLVVLLAAPSTDAHWEHQPSHGSCSSQPA